MESLPPGALHFEMLDGAGWEYMSTLGFLCGM